MRTTLLCGAAAIALVLGGCSPTGGAAAKPKEDATQFLARAEKESSDFSDYASRTAWVNANFITDDTDWLNSKAGSEGTQLSVRLANETKAYANAQLTEDQKRKMNI